MKKFIIIILFPLFIFSQSKKITGYLFIQDSICLGQDKQKQVIKLDAKNVIIHLSKDLLHNNKYLCKTNRKGKFIVKISEEELNYYRYLLFTGPNIETSFISLDSVPNQFKHQLINIKETEYSIGKPAIYLYPEKTQEISVQLKFKGKLKTTYPAYNEGWEVIVTPNGELTNKKDNRKYNYLFWDGVYNFPESHYSHKDGFLVKKENLTSFLISKLDYLGLNNTEINDFIVYWLPQLEQNEISLIHFWVNDNIDQSSILEINPKPNTEIIVFMEFKKVSRTYNIKEQILTKSIRNGFTVVEWGGTNLDTKRIIE